MTVAQRVAAWRARNPDTARALGKMCMQRHRIAKRGKIARQAMKKLANATK